MTRARAHRFARGIPALATMLLSALVFAGSPGYLDLRRIEPLRGDAGAGKAKAVVCGACHGATGISPVPAFPNLAGQRAEYLYWQLVEFKREVRPESPMTRAGFSGSARNAIIFSVMRRIGRTSR